LIGGRGDRIERRINVARDRDTTRSQRLGNGGHGTSNRRRLGRPNCTQRVIVKRIEVRRSHGGYGARRVIDVDVDRGVGRNRI